MRICYLSHSVSHFTSPYIDYFSALGHEVHLISFAHQDLPHAIMHHPVAGPFDPMKATWRYVCGIRKVKRILRELGPDVLHAHYLTSNAFIGALSGFHPLIVSARGSDVHQSLKSAVKRRIVLHVMKKADLVNPVSRELEGIILALGVPRSKLLCLSQGIETRAFFVDRTRRRPGPVRMICTRALRPLYQCDRIIRALAGLREQSIGFEFVFAGHGPCEEGLHAEVQRCGLCDSVRFLGGFEPGQLPELMGDADICVSASLWDGTSPALLEAMASGAFPVVSDIPANREWLTGDGDSLLFDPHDDRQLLEGLARAIGDSGLRSGAVETNRQRVLERGDRRTNMGLLASVYEKLASRCA